MLRRTLSLILPLMVVMTCSVTTSVEAQDFRTSKILLKNYVYYDQNVEERQGTFYCGCTWSWLGESGGRTDLSSCGFNIRSQRSRAERIEWDHVVPSWAFGHQRKCWKSGGRPNCAASDALYRKMESDLHNLVVSVGEINADKANYRFGMVTDPAQRYGQCNMKIDFKGRIVEPPDSVKGQVARIHFYMHDKYELKMSRQQQQLMIAWDKHNPVTAWEVERNNRVKKIVGYGNPFVSGEKVWKLGGGADGAQGLSDALRPDSIRGNLRSRVYHLPMGCPSYEKIGVGSIIQFDSEQAAIEAGYRKAGNCS